MSYTQCLLQYEPFDVAEVIQDTMYIPTKFAKEGKAIIVDKPVKRRAKVLKVFSTSTTEKVKRKTWDSSLPKPMDRGEF